MTAPGEADVRSATGAGPVGAEASPPAALRRRFTSTHWILLAMLVGALLGWAFPDARKAEVGFAASDLQVLSTIFLRLVKALIVPLLFATIVVGIAGQGDDLKRVGRLAVRAMVYFTAVTAIALLVGWGAALLARPGEGVVLGAVSAEEGSKLAQRKASLSGVLEGAVPQSFFESAAANDVLQVLVFSILFAVALTRVGEQHRRPLLAVTESLAEVMLRFTGLVMAYAPIGIGAAIAVTVGRGGIGVVARLGLLVLTLYAALLVLIGLVFVPIALLARIPIGPFLRAAREPSLIAFSAASSAAALPRALQNMEAFGVPRRIVGFVLPTALTLNLTGSTLFVALASLFVAQAAGLEMTTGQQAAMMLTLLLTSKGIATVPRASLVVLAATLSSAGLPLEGVAVVLAVDAVMDMARTGTNMLGHCLAAAVLARWEGELGSDRR